MAQDGQRKPWPSSVDVAKRAGVSQSAVSRTFSEKGYVSQQTRSKVLAAAEELGYQPSVIPRIMLTQRSRLIAIAVGGMYNPFNSRILEQFARTLQSNGYQMMLVHVEHGASLASVMPQLASYRADALFVARGVLSEETALSLSEYRIPIVAFHTPIAGDWFSSVCCDNHSAGRHIAELFVKRGAVRCAFVAGDPRGPSAVERLAGFRERLLELGLGEPAVVDASYTYDGGYQAAEFLLKHPAPPDAIFCTNDLIAIGCIERARLGGLHIPEDLMVAGFDDIPEAVWAGNDLTTFTQSGPTMVEASMQILKDVIEAEPQNKGVSVTIPVRLIERGSTMRVNNRPPLST